jgi:hypothetical protein
MISGLKWLSARLAQYVGYLKSAFVVRCVVERVDIMPLTGGFSSLRNLWRVCHEKREGGTSKQGSAR